MTFVASLNNKAPTYTQHLYNIAHLLFIGYSWIRNKTMVTEVLMRLSIEISSEQHQRLKASAALQGKSIKDYVLDRTLLGSDEQAALQELESFLKPRVEAAKKGDYSSKSIDAIFDEVEQEDIAIK
jgi:hypothetical protein